MVGNHAQLGEPGATLTYCRQALALCHEQGDRHGEANTWDSLGYAHHLLGDHDQAAERYHRAADLFRSEGDRHGEAGTLNRLGDTQHAARQREAAAESGGAPRRSSPASTNQTSRS